MERQEIFDTVATHLLTQNAKALALGTKTVCRYRGAGGYKCAVGCLIPDELYSDSIEGGGVSGWAVQEVLVAANVITREETRGPRLATDRLALLSELQIVHDTKFAENWKRALRGVADRFGLVAAVLDEVVTC